VHYAATTSCSVWGDVKRFAAELFEDEPLRKVRLYMAETESFDGSLTTSSPTVTPFVTTRASPKSRETCWRINRGDGRFAIQLLCQQRLHGVSRLAIRTSLKYRLFETLDRPMDIIEAAARLVIGDAMPRIERRWSGVYHQLIDRHRTRSISASRSRAESVP